MDTQTEAEILFGKPGAVAPTGVMCGHCGSQIITDWPEYEVSVVRAVITLCGATTFVDQLKARTALREIMGNPEA